MEPPVHAKCRHSIGLCFQQFVEVETKQLVYGHLHYPIGNLFNTAHELACGK